MKAVFAAFFSLVFLCAAAPAPGDSPQAILAARASAMPGAAIAAAVIDNGRVTTYFAGSTGTERKLDEHTLFEVGSVSKTFTATALASLVRAGTVRLSDPVSKYLPDFVRVPSRDGKAITLLNLATQHSGLPRLPSNMQTVQSANPYLSYSDKDLYAFLDGYHLPRDPGSRFEYSNLGFGLLGLALTRAAHASSYAALMKRTVFAPLHMDESEVAMSTAPENRLALGHDIDGDAVHSWEFTNATAGAGAIRSSLHDMIRYLQCNLGQGPLATTCLFAQKPRDTFSGHRIGLAWWTDDKTGVIEHGGDTAGFHSMVLVDPSHRKGVVVLSSGPQIGDVALHLLDPSSTVVSMEKNAVSDSALQQYAGRYANTDFHIDYTITRKGDALYAQIAGQDAARIYPSRWPDHFYYAVVPAYIEFVRQQRSVVGLILTQNGQHIPIYRLGSDGKSMASALTPAYPPAVTLDESTLRQYTGTYALAGADMSITLQNGHLFAQLAGQPAYEIYASAKDEFYYEVVDAQISFVRDASGKITGLVLHQTGRDIPAPRS